VRENDKKGLFGEHLRNVIKVASARLDDYKDQIDIGASLIWMDTQGYEGHILSGGKDLLEKGCPIVTEFWPYGLQKANGFDIFLSALEGGAYSKIVNLNDPSTLYDFSTVNLRKLADKLGFNGPYTDLLIY
jgi:hypothetical protein